MKARCFEIAGGVDSQRDRLEMNTSPTPRWKRVLVKLSGEALQGDQTHGLDPVTVTRIARDLAAAAVAGAQVGVVVGGGNFFRGLQGADKGIERARGDSIGMLATVMNALALEQAIEAQGQSARTLSAVAMPSICQPYSRQAALAHLAKGRVIVLGGGTGNPFFTTDTAAALRGSEISAEIVLKATKVDGVYTADPKKDPNATLFNTITFDDAIAKHLQVMDATAFALCRDQKLPIKVFSITKPGALMRVIMGEDEGTLVHV